MPLALVLVLYAGLSGTRMRAVSNALMSMALRPFVFAAPASIWRAAGQHVTRRTGSYFRCQSCFPPSLLPGRSSIALRCARGTAPIAILHALPLDVPVLMVFLPRAPHRCSPKFPNSPCRSRWPRLALYLFLDS